MFAQRRVSQKPQSKVLIPLAGAGVLLLSLLAPAVASAEEPGVGATALPPEIALVFDSVESAYVPASSIHPTQIGDESSPDYNYNDWNQGHPSATAGVFTQGVEGLVLDNSGGKRLQFMKGSALGHPQGLEREGQKIGLKTLEATFAIDTVEPSGSRDLTYQIAVFYDEDTSRKYTTLWHSVDASDNLWASTSAIGSTINKWAGGSANKYTIDEIIDALGGIDNYRVIAYGFETGETSQTVRSFTAAGLTTHFTQRPEPVIDFGAPGTVYVPVSTIHPFQIPDESSPDYNYNQWNQSKSPSRSGAFTQTTAGLRFVNAPSQAVQFMKGSALGYPQGLEFKGQKVGIQALADSFAISTVEAAGNRNLSYQIAVFYDADDKYTSLWRMADSEFNNLWTSTRNLGTTITAWQAYPLDDIITALGGIDNYRVIGFGIDSAEPELTVRSLTAAGVRYVFTPKPVTPPTPPTPPAPPVTSPAEALDTGDDSEETDEVDEQEGNDPQETPAEPPQLPDTASLPQQAQVSVSFNPSSGQLGVPLAGVSDGDQVHAYFFSTPVSAGWQTVKNGTASWSVLNSGLEPGEHRIVVQNTAGEIVGWSTFEVPEEEDPQAVPSLPGAAENDHSMVIWVVVITSIVVVIGLIVIRRKFSWS